MKLFQRILLLCLLGAMVFALAPIDISDGGYSEPDAVLDVSHTALLARTHASPALASAVSLAAFTPQTPRRLPSGFRQTLRTVKSRDLQKLLCVFLI